MAEEENVHARPGDTKRTISVALLVTGEPPKEVQDSLKGGYEIMFRDMFATALASIPRFDWHPKMSLQIQAFNVVLGEFPEIEELDEGKWDVVVITGSRTSVLKEDEVWIHVLSRYITHLVDEHPLVRIVGIGFGHQLIVRIYGGSVVEDRANGEYGVADIQLTPEGIEMLSPIDKKTTWRLEQVHSDSVVEAPKPVDDDEWILLGSSAKCKYQGFVLRYPTHAPPLPHLVNTSSYIAFDVDDVATGAAGPMPIRSAHILTLQGHPELNAELTKAELTCLCATGQMDWDARDYALAQAQSGVSDGAQTAQMLLAMLSVEPAVSDVPLDT